MAVREVESIVYDQGTPYMDILLSGLTFTDTVAWLRAKGTSVSPDLRAEEGCGVGGIMRSVGRFWWLCPLAVVGGRRCCLYWCWRRCLEKGVGGGVVVLGEDG